MSNHSAEREGDGYQPKLVHSHLDSDKFIDEIDPADMRDGAELRAVAAAMRAVREAEAATQAAVAAALAAGHSPTMVALMLEDQ